jgi:hypothetical protein
MYPHRLSNMHVNIILSLTRGSYKRSFPFRFTVQHIVIPPMRDLCVVLHIVCHLVTWHRSLLSTRRALCLPKRGCYLSLQSCRLSSLFISFYAQMRPSCDSSVGIVTMIRCWRVQESWFGCCQEQEVFYFHIDSAAHLLPCFLKSGSSFMGRVKWENTDDQSLPPNSASRSEWRYTSASPYVSLVWCLRKIATS